MCLLAAVEALNNTETLKKVLNARDGFTVLGDLRNSCRTVFNSCLAGASGEVESTDKNTLHTLVCTAQRTHL